MTAAARIDLDNVVDLDEWARRTNAETRRVMGVRVREAFPSDDPTVPKASRLQLALGEAREILDELMTDKDAAACVQADLERLQASRELPDDSSFAAACRAADEKARRKPADPRVDRLRGLMADDVTLDRAWQETAHPWRAEGRAAARTLMAAEFLVREGDAERLRRWLDRHGTSERQAILRHLEQRKGTRAQ